MIWLFHALFPSVGRAGTYRRLTDDREFLKMSRRNSHVPIALVGMKKSNWWWEIPCCYLHCVRDSRYKAMIYSCHLRVTYGMIMPMSRP